MVGLPWIRVPHNNQLQSADQCDTEGTCGREERGSSQRGGTGQMIDGHHRGVLHPFLGKLVSDYLLHP